jgi:hypothetical protein
MVSLDLINGARHRARGLVKVIFGIEGQERKVQAHVFENPDYNNLLGRLSLAEFLISTAWESHKWFININRKTYNLPVTYVHQARPSGFGIAKGCVLLINFFRSLKASAHLGVHRNGRFFPSRSVIGATTSAKFCRCFWQKFMVAIVCLTSFLQLGSGIANSFSTRFGIIFTPSLLTRQPGSSTSY